MRRARTSLYAATVIGALVALGVSGAPSANADNARRKVARTAPSWVAHATSTGHASGTKRTSFRLYLAPNGGLAALKADVAAISDPSSSRYHQYLSAAQYHATYDATAAEVAKVSGFLRDNGLDTATASYNRYLTVKGTNAQVEKAFGVSLRTFKHKGYSVQANTSAATVPADVAPYVLTISGLDTTPHLVKHAAAPSDPPAAGFQNGRPCSRYYGQIAAKYQADYKTPLPKFQGKVVPYAVCGYTGPQYRSAYEGNTKLNGNGVTVAVVDAYDSPTIKSDTATYAARNGDGSYYSGQLTQVDAPAFTNAEDCGPSGWYGEQTLDIEAVHAMAPKANIRYYGAASCYDNDFLDTLGTVVDENQASLVSNSWGDSGEQVDPDSVAAYEQIILQGAVQGISFLFSSGDNGDEVANTGLRQADFPASDPYVTAVGGTADAIGADGTFAFQTGWGTYKYSLNAAQTKWKSLGYLYGAGGGNSGAFPQPSYQQGVVPSSNGSGRAVPDIAMDADPTTGMLVGQTQTFSDGVRYGEYRIGGTSLASPLFAGLSALRQQKQGARLGFQNPTIYKTIGKDSLTDVNGNPGDAGNVRTDYANGEDASGGLLYTVRTFNQDSSLTTGPGWDDVTGVGSPNRNWVFVKP